jgi:hypothetical protein
MRPQVRRAALILLALLLVAVPAVAQTFGFARWERHVGYFGPAFAPDGRTVYVVVRRTSGPTWGLGWENLTAPATAYPIVDEVALVRIDVATGRRDTLEEWGASPVARRVLHAYRGHIFHVLRAVVRPEVDGTVAYEIELSIPVVPASEVHHIIGTWSGTAARRRGEWTRAGSEPQGVSEPIVAGDLEVLAPAGDEHFPCAVVVLDPAARAARPLSDAAACHSRYPNGLRFDDLLALSRKADIDRLSALTRRRNEVVAQYRAQGMLEGDALIKSWRTLQDEGRVPRSPRIVAEVLTPEQAAAARASVPLFDIVDEEMASGLFPDIERALQAPGDEIDQAWLPYGVHRDYTNSVKVSAYLEGGGREFLVRYRQKTYRLRVIR